MENETGRYLGSAPCRVNWCSYRWHNGAPPFDPRSTVITKIARIGADATWEQTLN